MNCFRLRGQAKYFEPIHLVPMSNICRQQGHESRIFQYGLPDLRRSIKDVVAFKPDVLGLSFIGHFDEPINGAKRILRSLGSPPLTILGGTDIQYHSDVYVEELGSFFKDPDLRKKGKWLLLVSNEGEHFMQGLAAENFALDPAFRKFSRELLQIGDTGFYLESRGNALLAAPLPAIKLNDLDFTRDYPPGAINDYSAQVKWESGCWGKCFFCGNVPERVDYRSPELAVQDARDLISRGARKIHTASANFTADPERASAIVEKLPFIKEGYSFTTRVDSLYAAIKRHPDAWKRFSSIGGYFDIGVESFIPERLVRLGKYRTLEQAQKQEDRLLYILDFFKGSKVESMFYLIGLDWQMDLSEAWTEAERMWAYAMLYPHQVVIDPMVVGKHVVFGEGSRWSETMDSIDYIKFERDPRLLVLAALMRKKNDERPVARSFFAEQMYQKAYLSYYLGAISRLRKIPPETFDLEQLLAAGQRAGKMSGILKAAYRQMGFFEGRRLRLDLDRLFSRSIYENRGWAGDSI